MMSEREVGAEAFEVSLNSFSSATDGVIWDSSLRKMPKKEAACSFSCSICDAHKTTCFHLQILKFVICGLSDALWHVAHALQQPVHTFGPRGKVHTNNAVEHRVNIFK